MEGNIRVLKSFFTISAALNTNHKPDAQRMKSRPSLVDSANSCFPTLHFASEYNYVRFVWMLLKCRYCKQSISELYRTYASLQMCFSTFTQSIGIDYHKNMTKKQEIGEAQWQTADLKDKIH